MLFSSMGTAVRSPRVMLFSSVRTQVRSPGVVLFSNMGTKITSHQVMWPWGVAKWGPKSSEALLPQGLYTQHQNNYLFFSIKNNSCDTHLVPIKYPLGFMGNKKYHMPFKNWNALLHGGHYAFQRFVFHNTNRHITPCKVPCNDMFKKTIRLLPDVGWLLEWGIDTCRLST